MPKRRDILAIVLIVLPWTLLITVWHQSTIAPLLAVHKDDGGDSRRDLAAGLDSKEYCLSDRDIVEVVRTEYVYTRPPPWSDTLPTIHVVTPTYSRPVQKAELTRLANTLLHVPNLHWILVEDSQRRTPLITRLLRDTGLNYTHLNVETPRNYKLRGDMRDPRIPRGTMQRNLALRWLRETFNKNNSQPGIVYFADDDNTYSLELFEEESLGFLFLSCCLHSFALIPECPLVKFCSCQEPGACSAQLPSRGSGALSALRLRGVSTVIALAEHLVQRCSAPLSLACRTREEHAFVTACFSSQKSRAFPALPWRGAVSLPGDVEHSGPEHFLLQHQGMGGLSGRHKQAMGLRSQPGSVQLQEL
uniref:Galactosylgalactosylxylosylprotein 3-beta-glucuronosyltransferase n=1 Tax=Bubo bubo TaxID=30461 RepID=A0A8C0ICA3_BUBBB